MGGLSYDSGRCGNDSGQKPGNGGHDSEPHLESFPLSDFKLKDEWPGGDGDDGD